MKASLDLLMKDKNWHSTFKKTTKARIKAEYVTLLLNAMFLVETSDMITNETLWYKLLTNERLWYKLLTNERIWYKL